MLIKVTGLKKRYKKSLPFIIRGIDFTVDRGQTVGIFGESGSGKSTIAQILAGIHRPTEGKIFLSEQPLKKYKGESRRKVQILFQHPEISFDPKMKVIKSIKEPYDLYKMPFEERVFYDYLEMYGIYPEHMDRYPSELSGGELQRMALARAMLVEPEFLILDEPTSMLDVISQAQIIKILRTIQEKRGTGYLFISHDEQLCRSFCDKIYYLENGKFIGCEEKRIERNCL